MNSRKTKESWYTPTMKYYSAVKKEGTPRNEMDEDMVLRYSSERKNSDPKKPTPYVLSVYHRGWKHSLSGPGWWSAEYIHMPKFIEFCPEDFCTFMFISYTSIKNTKCGKGRKVLCS